MARSLAYQLLLLVKKNFILQIRRPLGAAVELFLPCIFLGLIAMTRLLTPIEQHCFSYFDPLNPAAFHENYPNLSMIVMAPDNEFVRNVANHMAQSHDILQDYKVKPYTDDEISDLLAELGNIDLTDPDDWSKLFDMARLGKIFQYTIAVVSTVEKLKSVIVENSGLFSAAVEWYEDPASSHKEYTLRLAQRFGFATDRTYPSYFSPGPWLGAGYDQGWVALQQAIDRGVMLTSGGMDEEDIPIMAIRQMPYPTWEEDGFANAVRNSLPLMLVISFLWIGASISKELVGEKCSRMKETMKMMGLANWVLWASWVIQRLVLMALTVLLMVIVLKAANYLMYTNAIILFIFLLEYAISVMCFCFFLSTLFSKTTTAIAGTMLGYFALYIPYFFLGNDFDNLSNRQRYLACLLTSTCMGFGANIISKWETMKEGLQFSNVGSQTSDLDLFTMGDVMLMIFVDIIIYSLLTWYIEAVFPGEYGIKQKPWFFLTRKYWCGSSPKAPEDLELKDMEDEQDLGAYEKGPKDKKIGIAIRNLVKRFKTPKGKITAVNGLSLDMYEDQITSLLGHNGAGKTTTMSMLTGLYSPSGGEATINGHSILEDMDQVRDSLGICPQHNVLFDRLTVKEHLDFFIKLKGYTGDVEAEATKMIQMLQLADKTNAKADQLSGGMKRKLSVGIALAGGSKVVILDEPTAGMDPYARRATWDLILENKPSRTILLTTHYMDEADFLGDRIAIMTAGKLVCSGSSLFLKKKYGVGYHLTLVKGAGCDVSAVDYFLKSHISTAQQISNVGSELVYILPDNEVSKFVELFQRLEGRDLGEKAKIESFGLSLTTLEEVFIKVGEEEKFEQKTDEIDDDKEKDIHKEKEMEAEENRNGNIAQFKVFDRKELNSGAALLLQQLLAMVTKRFINTKRYKKGIIVQLILPVVFSVLGLLVLKTASSSSAEDGSYEVLRKIDLSVYPGQGIEGRVYLADLTDNSDPFFNDKLKSYLSTVNLKTKTDLTTDINTLIALYNSKTADSCCTEDALQLTEACAVKGDVESNWTTCEDNEEWGYEACYLECFLPQFIDKDTGKAIPCGDRRPPDVKYRGDKLSYFTNAFLDLIGDDTKFYRKNQVAFTYSDLPPFVDLMNVTDGTYFEEPDNADYMLGSLTSDAKLLTGWFSHEGLHLAPGVQNALSNQLLVRHGSSVRISCNNYPLPQSLADRFMMAGVSAEGGSLAILMLLGFTFLTSSFVLFIVEERENKSKHLQQISGVNGAVYWCGTLAWDMINYLVCILVITILFAAFDIGAFGANAIGAVFVLLMMYGFAAIPFVYLLSLLFSSAVSAFSLIVTLTFISGLAGYIANLILTAFQDDAQETVENVLLILPNFNFIQGLSNIYGNGVQRELFDLCVGVFGEAPCASMGIVYKSVYNTDSGSFSLGIGKQLIALAVIGVLSFSVVILQEFFGKRLRVLLERSTSRVSAADLAAPSGEDDDVQAERTRVKCEVHDLARNSALVMTNLRKCYGNKIAVQNLTLGIPKNECFGLLGVNGAGKTTTFSMLTGDVSVSGGEAFVAGYDLMTNLRQIQQRIGYCPQFDALINIMTGRELLRMFAQLRGIPSSQIEGTVAEAITNLNLEKYADKLCGGYSGGNKRKLSTAIALVGNPEVLFLDEPTAGMDPAARRFLWTVLSQLTASKVGTSIVLTTHSMEECEALCNRLAIMVNGAFRCLGSIQHLKNKYGEGYTVTLKMPDERQTECSTFIERTFRDAILKETHLGYLQYQLNPRERWSAIFHELESNKGKLGIEDYAVNQTSLEQVFLGFAKDQMTEDDGVKKKKRWFGRKTPPRHADPSTGPRVSVNRGASVDEHGV